jgi:hypothetical protein
MYALGLHFGKFFEAIGRQVITLMSIFTNKVFLQKFDRSSANVLILCSVTKISRYATNQRDLIGLIFGLIKDCLLWAVF